MVKAVVAAAAVVITILVLVVVAVVVLVAVVPFLYEGPINGSSDLLKPRQSSKNKHRK